MVSKNLMFLDHLARIRKILIKEGEMNTTQLAKKSFLPYGQLHAMLNYPVASNTFFIFSRKVGVSRKYFVQDDKNWEIKKNGNKNTKK